MMRYGISVGGLILCGCAASDIYKGEYERQRFSEHSHSKRIPLERVDDEDPPLIQCEGVSHRFTEILGYVGDAVRSRILQEDPPNPWMRHEGTIAELLDESRVSWIRRVAVEAGDEAYDAIVLTYVEPYPDETLDEIGWLIGATTLVDIVIVPCRWEVIDVFDWTFKGDQ